MDLGCSAKNYLNPREGWLQKTRHKTKKPTVPCNPSFFTWSLGKPNKKPVVGNEFCEEEGPREPRFPSKTDFTTHHSTSMSSSTLLRFLLIVAVAADKEPTVFRNNPPFNGVSFAEEPKAIEGVSALLPVSVDRFLVFARVFVFGCAKQYLVASSSVHCL